MLEDPQNGLMNEEKEREAGNQGTTINRNKRETEVLKPGLLISFDFQFGIAREGQPIISRYSQVVMCVVTLLVTAN